MLSRKMRWAERVAPLSDRGKACWVLVENSERKYPLEDLGVYERVMLNCIIKTYDGRLWSEFIQPSTGASGGLP